MDTNSGKGTLAELLTFTPNCGSFSSSTGPYWTGKSPCQCGPFKKQYLQKVWTQAVANWGDSFQDWPTVLPLLVSKKLHND